MQKSEKIIGTLLPLFALKHPDFDSGQRFLDWLKKTGQSAWLLLPLHETQLEQDSTSKHVPSPYKSYGVGLDPRYQSAPGLSDIDGSLREAFIFKHKDWLHDYALFSSLRDHFGTDDWSTWDISIRHYEPGALKSWSVKLGKEIEKYKDVQWRLHANYDAFHNKAQTMKIALIGDLPYYPSFRSPLVWAHQQVFQITADGGMANVSGIPDTAGTHFGRQIWGHPLYNWETQKENVIVLWKLRLRYLASIFDHIRFDHAKAFFAYGVMDINNPHKDRYIEGPGEKVFEELVSFAQHEGLTIFAEDSGDRTKELREVLEKINLPGIRIFRFAIKGNELHARYGDIKNYPENCVASTTTHDTETLLGTVEKLTMEEKVLLSQCSGVSYISDKQFSKDVRNAIIASNAKMVIIPMQDWLLTTDRINVPGTEKEVNDTNWQYSLDIPLEELPTQFS